MLLSQSSITHLSFTDKPNTLGGLATAHKRRLQSRRTHDLLLCYFPPIRDSQHEIHHRVQSLPYDCTIAVLSCDVRPELLLDILQEVSEDLLDCCKGRKCRKTEIVDDGKMCRPETKLPPKET
jgi:hypothetical protein